MPADTTLLTSAPLRLLIDMGLQFSWQRAEGFGDLTLERLGLCLDDTFSSALDPNTLLCSGVRFFHSELLSRDDLHELFESVSAHREVMPRPMA